MFKNELKIIAFIATSIVMTLGIQVYWNMLQYNTNRLMILNEVQGVLDEVVEEFSQKASANQIPAELMEFEDFFALDLDTVKRTVSKIVKNLKEFESIDFENIDFENESEESVSITFYNSNINLDTIYHLAKAALAKKNMYFDFKISYILEGEQQNSVGSELSTSNTFTARTNMGSSVMPSVIEMVYVNPIKTTLVRSLTGLISSFVLLFIVVLTLIYLLKIIQRQKKLSEIKNDFISNITHEFKTPIATVSSAIEAVKNFNNENLSDRSRKYLDMSELQLQKLNLLVEKVLETALLESEKLTLNKSSVDLYLLILEVSEKRNQNTPKKITFSSKLDTVLFDLDEFHFENVIANLIENAINYGGDEIEIQLDENDNKITIHVSDNGRGIHKDDVPYIFDKFYRSKRNDTNKIKGFGIGLYYCKNIVEKHNGTLTLSKANTFTITLWKK